MTFIDRPPLISALWPPRPEDRMACATRISNLIRAIDNDGALDGFWVTSDGALPATDPTTIGELIAQNLRDLDKTPIEELGWSGFFWRLLTVEGSKKKSQIARLELRCGGWFEKNQSRFFPISVIRDDRAVSRRMLLLQIEAFDATSGFVSSQEGLARSSDLRLPWPRVDWMVYLRAHIPASELPAAVHAVEHIAGGTLVTLSETPIDISKPEDLALVEAVEPVIHRYLPPEPPKPTVQGAKTTQ